MKETFPAVGVGGVNGGLMGGLKEGGKGGGSRGRKEREGVRKMGRKVEGRGSAGGRIYDNGRIDLESQDGCLDLPISVDAVYDSSFLSMTFSPIEAISVTYCWQSGRLTRRFLYVGALGIQSVSWGS